ncbi:TDT family transporter, partial [uncultured Cetobacterium sp.]|uniref:TDT family transporter n=1 Tax=uncultured Cetobacterium sp. TaxID=527638 RepID=UPI00261C4482
MKRIPTPISGLALAIASLGLLLESVFPSNKVIQYSLGFVALFFIVLLTIRFIKYPITFFNDLKHPVINSVIPTYSMSLMAISKSIYNLNKSIGLGIWFFSIGLHLFFLFMFLKEQKKIFKVENLIPSWFVPPVGIVVACVSMPDKAYISVAQVIFWFGFTFYIILLPIMLNRVLFYDKIATEKQPTIAIFAAPSSLCLAGYLNAFPAPNFVIVTFLFGMALLFTGTIYMSFYHILKENFHYGFAALTFPMVI